MTASAGAPCMPLAIPMKQGFFLMNEHFHPRRDRFQADKTLRLWLALLAGAYWMATSLLHLELSKLIVSSVSTPFGNFRPSDYSSVSGWVGLTALVLIVFLRARRGQHHLRTSIYWLFLLAVIFAANRLLLFSPNEYVHYPQYAILVILMCLSIDPDRTRWPFVRILFWGTFMGIIDEVNQYLFVCPSYGDYLDFNDFFLNQLGVVTGLLLVYGFHAPENQDRPTLPLFKSVEVKLVAVCFVILILLHAAGRLYVTPPKEVPPGGIALVNGKKAIYIEKKPGIMGNWNKVSKENEYYVLAPAGGLFLLLMTGLIFSTYDPRFSRQLFMRPRFMSKRRKIMPNIGAKNNNNLRSMDFRK